MRLPIRLLILLGLAGATCGRGQPAGAGFRLVLRPGDWERISILPASPAGARLDLERGSPEAAAQRAVRIGPLVGEKTRINGAIGRIAVSPSGAKDVFWTFSDRLGRIYWPPGAGALGPGVALAERLDSLAGPDAPARLEALAGSLEPGSWIEIQLRVAPLLLRIACGPAGETSARTQLEVERGRDLAQVPVPGTRAPAWRTEAGAPRAWMLVGRTLVFAQGADLGGALALAGSRFEPVPLAPSPDAGP